MIALPSPNAAQLRAFYQDEQAKNSAFEARRSLGHLVDTMRPATLAVIAEMLSPGIPLLNALGELQIKINGLAASAEAFNALAAKEDQDFRERMKPVFDKAVIRFFDLGNQIPGLKKSIAFAVSEHPRKIQRLVEAGLTNEEAVNAVGELNDSERQSELAAWVVEHAALERFIRSYDINDLPENFVFPEGFVRQLRV